MRNLLLNYDREEIFDKIIETDIFDYYAKRLHQDDFCTLQNDIAYFISTLETKIVKE
jgi:hypothetical protein